MPQTTAAFQRNTKTPQGNKITVFYDGQCGLCSKEINFYRRLAPVEIFDWQDITESDICLKSHGIELSAALRHLHASDIHEQIHVGVDAFLLIWKHIKYWNLLAKLIGLPVIYQITAFAYEIFAQWRFKRLKHCQASQSQETV